MTGQPDIIALLRKDVDKARALVNGRKVSARYSPSADAVAALAAVDALAGVVERLLTYAEALAALGVLPGLSRPATKATLGADGWPVSLAAEEPAPAPLPGFVSMRRAVGMRGSEVMHEERLFPETEVDHHVLNGWERTPEPAWLSRMA